VIGGIGGQSAAISIVCMSVCSHLKNHSSKYHQILCKCSFCLRSVILWQQCDTLRTSGFVDDIMFHIMEPMGQNQAQCYVSSLRNGPGFVASALGAIILPPHRYEGTLRIVEFARCRHGRQSLPPPTKSCWLLKYARADIQKRFKLHLITSKRLNKNVMCNILVVLPQQQFL